MIGQSARRVCTRPDDELGSLGSDRWATLGAGTTAAQEADAGTAERPATEERPAAIAESIVVTAGRSEQEIAEVPVLVTILSRADLDLLPAHAVDQLLRDVPAFNLQRAESSRVISQQTDDGDLPRVRRDVGEPDAAWSTACR